MARQPVKPAANLSDVESQDTQQAVLVLHQQFGVDLGSILPSQPLYPDQVQPHNHNRRQQRRRSRLPLRDASTSLKPIIKTFAKSKAKSAKDNPASRGGAEDGADKHPSRAWTSFNADNFNANHGHASGCPSSQCHSPYENIINGHDVTSLAAINDHHGAKPRDAGTSSRLNTESSSQHLAVPGRRNMCSLQSQTQANEGRSYEQYISHGDDLIFTNSTDTSTPQQSKPTALSQDENRTLHDQDTGTVNFDHIVKHRDDLSILDSSRSGKPSLGSPGQSVGNPETPAPSRNPFAGSRAHLLPGSQMFKHTQASSAAYRTLSPTSSRPSPDHLPFRTAIAPDEILSSPLKNAAMAQSPLQAIVSSPHLLDIFGTSPKLTPRGQGLLEHGAEASTPLRRSCSSRRREEEYEVADSWQHRSESSPPPALESHSDVDDRDDAERRRRRARHKKAAAEKQLRSIDYEPQSTGRDMAGSSANARKSTTRIVIDKIHLDQCKGKKADKESQITVQDSQKTDMINSAAKVDDRRRHIDSSHDAVLLPEGHAANHGSSNEGVVLDSLPNTDCSPPLSSTPPAARRANDEPGSMSGAGGKPTAVLDPVPSYPSPARLLHPTPLGEMLPHSCDEASSAVSFSSLLASSTRSTLSTRNGCQPNPFIVDGRSNPTSDAQPPAGRLEEKMMVSDKLPDQNSNDAVSNKPSTSKATYVAETSPVVRSLSPAPISSTEIQRCGTGFRTSKSNTEFASSPTSGLSELTSTPTISIATSSLTEDSPRKAGTSTLSKTDDDLQARPPTVAKADESKSSAITSKPKARTARQESHRYPTRRSRQSLLRNVFASTDELTTPSSLASTTFERSAVLSRMERIGLKEPPASGEMSRGRRGKIFAGMAFAISFQPKQAREKDSHYNSRMGLLAKTMDKIKDEGGMVLATGFDQLFESLAVQKVESISSTPPRAEEIKLAAAAKTIGFVALIADGHSRKVKFMQALALGLPCLHERWITTCVEKNKVVDWSDYLLCAGNSWFLGDAMRSRNLPTYDATSSELSTAIGLRPQILRDARILLVLRKAEESKKMAFVFLARALGASLSRVYSVDQAKRHLKAMEDKGHDYDWLYVEENIAGRAGLFTDSAPATGASASASGLAASKKRKRSMGLENAPAPRRIRFLSDELVIQSLILGRMLEDDEIDALGDCFRLAQPCRDRRTRTRRLGPAPVTL